MTTPIPTTAPTPADVIGMRRSKPLPVLRTVYAVVIVVAVLAVLRSLAGNEALDWPTVREYFFDPAVMEGLRRTLVITVLAIVIAIVLGVVVANMRLSKNPVLRGSSWTYVWFFRSIPLLVLLVLAYNLSLVYPEITISIPFGPELFSTSTQDLVSPMVAAVAAFGLQQAAYTSEVLRASIQSVPVGQREAAAALGMSHARTMWRIVLPQAMRVAIPPVANETINLLKATSLVAFISVPDLLYSVQQIYSSTFQVVPLLLVATLWYMVIVSVLSGLQYLIERRLRRAPGRRTARPTAVAELADKELS
ncbi:amino acid ABC transporter permease [Pimelobacter simplex]|uniref:Polar amino acid ABC transporter, inner membrane subunit n=1 Tax=Nocardioides simplex TaxID=2045 RepID=A0A0C5XG35_NOCSI|nr:amino acid ABC transporter permease [Pimelobacter simplex]AJR18146.1 polar amino acid ABC transporter, inner membrane subunit [Pimelobacter simplex]MCG8153075.1 ABC transporter permease subunit [Pimelobacter simplex]GEB12038.1 amino acid ABC transporter permease [Pimelobacter simplex]SFN04816.1 amino acid ABC transporter membrane protein, PAAT family [Pimelobacter simplex]